MTVLICVGSSSNPFTTRNEYPVINDYEGDYIVKSNNGSDILVPLIGCIWRFKIKEEKHIAVSGDQSLFELLQSPDDHLYVYRGNDNDIFSAPTQWERMELIAQRKPVKYVPVIGDNFTVNDENELGILTCHFIAGDGYVYSHNDKNEVYAYSPKYNTFTKA